jgi:hypothetical protein
MRKVPDNHEALSAFVTRETGVDTILTRLHLERRTFQLRSRRCDVGAMLEVKAAF